MGRNDWIVSFDSARTTSIREGISILLISAIYFMLGCKNAIIVDVDLELIHV